MLTRSNFRFTRSIPVASPKVIAVAKLRIQIELKKNTRLTICWLRELGGRGEETFINEQLLMNNYQ
jgi:hypothetical protein